MIKRAIGFMMLKIFGWGLKLHLPKKDFKKCVMIAAPHTTNWDFYFLWGAFWYMNTNLKFFIKDTYTKPWYGFIFKSLGAVGVNRSKNNNLVDYAVEYLKSQEEAVFVIPAEGTRKRVPRWKKGFYHIAKKSDLPIALGYLDYEKKLAGVGKMIYTSDDDEKDFQQIEDFYKTISGKYPELYNSEIYLRKNNGK